MSDKLIKEKVREFWNKEPCGTAVSSSNKYTRQYFDEIEDFRYSVEPEIFSFAQFSRFRDQKILEVGVGAGTDFLQWVRAGAKAYGVDLTEESINHVISRLKIYGLSAEELRVADAENLPYPDNNFDLVYSWGVIHHTPDTIKALDEIIRVTRVGGKIKVMIYNICSLNAFYQYLYFGLLRFKPFKSFSWIIYHHMESIGTKAFSVRKIRKILAERPVYVNYIKTRVTNYDLLWNKPLPFRIMAYVLASLLGFDRVGWAMTIELVKTD